MRVRICPALEQQLRHFRFAEFRAVTEWLAPRVLRRFQVHSTAFVRIEAQVQQQC
jgi:hypothetical protein